ncbi:MAG: L,D-transpeptidase family protein [Vicinamibacteria bacterium]|nr:L,D-transpeptidase family protein [Vicinamibacteria bacterium]
MSLCPLAGPVRALAFSLGLAAAVAGFADDQDPAAVREARDSLLAHGQQPGRGWPVVGEAERAPLRELYAAEPGDLFWFEGGRARPALADALRTLAATPALGLDPGDYDVERLAAAWLDLGIARARAEFDVALSASALRLLRDVRQGRVEPRQVGFDYDLAPRQVDFVAVLRAARDLGSVAAAVHAAEPSFGAHDRLIAALAHYRTLAAAGEPPPLPPPPAGHKKIAPGEAWAGLPGLAVRLQAFGDLAADASLPALAANAAPTYEGPLVAAVRHFQARHALEPDGVIGAGTLEALAVSPSARVRQIELALERLRWLPPLGEPPIVFVNVPLFRLWALDPADRGRTLQMKVVVGQSMGHATPLFVARMEHVIFRPLWSPPYSIVRRELLPQQRRDPGYFARQQLEIVDRGDEQAPALPATETHLSAVAAGRLFLRQRPGPQNSLGLAKFIFPNPQDVYMHGTPATALFSRARRDFSHGCIRVEDPTALAEWVLHGQAGWDRERIEKAMSGPRPERVDLEREPLVLVFYDTAWVDPAGVVHFAQDLYGHDARLDAALRARRRHYTSQP